MKSIVAAALLASVTAVSVAQVRFIEAPYPGTVARPLETTPQVSMPVLASALNTPTSTTGTTMQAGFEVTGADINIRRALVRWTKMIGWTFEPEHWTLDRDIPIAGSASLGSDFKAATRGLLLSTEMTDLPAQPCFYSNNVLRVIPINELCSRQQAAKAP